MKSESSGKQAVQSLMIIGVMALTLLFAFLYNRAHPVAYIQLTQDGISYARAEVVEIESEDLEDEDSTNRQVGIQQIKVQVLNGKHKGDVIELPNELSSMHNIHTYVGTRIILKIDEPDGVEPYYSVFNYDRTAAIGAMLVTFMVLLGVIGRGKGLRSLCNIVYALGMIFLFLLPQLYRGSNAVLVTLAAALMITGLSMLLLNGFSMKSYMAILSSMAGLCTAALFYLIFSGLFHMNGYNLETAEDLLIIEQSTGLEASRILFISVLIASLGAVMDISMSMVTSLYELKTVHPELSAKQMMTSGMHIGRDMIGANCETLILAFAGGSLATLLVLISYGVQSPQLWNSDYVAEELLESLCGSMAVILTVPLSTVLMSLLCCKDASRGKK